MWWIDHGKNIYPNYIPWTTKIMFSSLLVCQFVCLPVSNITDERMNESSLNCQEKYDTRANLGMFRWTPWTRDFFPRCVCVEVVVVVVCVCGGGVVYFSHITENGLADFCEFFTMGWIWYKEQDHLGYTVLDVARLLHAPQTRRCGW